MATVAKVWNGAASLKRDLVAIDTLEPFDGNPRRGDVEALRASLRRFGQVRSVLADGTRLIAGHHIVAAAKLEGYTHVAATQHEFADEDERRAYLLADNRLASLGDLDDALLVEQLKLLAEVDGFEGTGFTNADLDAALEALRSLDAEPVIKAERGQREHRDPSIKEIVLLWTGEQFAQAEVWMGIVAREQSLEGTSEVVYAALRMAAQSLNG